jgi:D-galactose 1-dehydrogenase/L-arabinose 1- dehydrogenase
MTSDLRIGLVGFGKIARDQHLPAIAGTPGARLVAVASPHAEAPGVASYRDIETMLAAEPELDAVAMCQPPQFRYEAARTALAAGKHVFLEKPPGATLSEVEALIVQAKAQGVTLFAGWHSRHAAAVAQARDWLEGRPLRKATITWKEDVRHWHPGQTWIWQAGGFGVFDPGVNALSILTEILREPVLLSRADLQVPSNRQAPIAATLAMRTAGGIPIEAVFDFRQTGTQSWDIAVEAENGRMLLSEGGNRLAVDGVVQATPPEREYPTLYRHFLDLVRSGRSDVDLAPLRLVADAFLCGRFETVAAFED